MIRKIERMYELYKKCGDDALKCADKTKAALNPLRIEVSGLS
jgi:hypothetical protein